MKKLMYAEPVSYTHLDVYKRQMQHHFSQVKQVQDTAKALSDFLDGCDKIEPAYQQQAMAEDVYKRQIQDGI